MPLTSFQPQGLGYTTPKKAWEWSVPMYTKSIYGNHCPPRTFSWASCSSNSSLFLISPRPLRMPFFPPSIRALSPFCPHNTIEICTVRSLKAFHPLPHWPVHSQHCLQGLEPWVLCARQGRERRTSGTSRAGPYSTPWQDHILLYDLQQVSWHPCVSVCLSAK